MKICLILSIEAMVIYDGLISTLIMHVDPDDGKLLNTSLCSCQGEQEARIMDLSLNLRCLVHKSI